MPPHEPADPTIAWRDWSATTFAQARADRRPVLLALGTAWSEACAHLDDTGYRDPALVTIVADRFVPVRVDADDRPDIDARYGLGGYPATLCLTPDGEVLDGAVLLDGSAIASMLRRAADAVADRGEAIAAGTRAAVARRARARAAVQSAPADDLSPIQWLERRLLEAFDPRYGGFGDGPKMPHLGALGFALRRHRETGDPALGRVVTTSLDAMASQGLHDPIDGGLYRCAESADWSEPHSEKLLEYNAEALQLYLDAWQVFGRSSYREVADAVRRYVVETLWSAARRGFRNSQRADGGYHALGTAAARAAAPAPPVDPRVYVPSSARMISALFQLGLVTGSDDAAARAQEALDQLLLRAYEPGGGVGHTVEAHPPVRGLLIDQVRVGAAALDAHDATGDDVYGDLAQEIMLFVLRVMRDDRTGGLLDRAPAASDDAVGLLREPMTSAELTGEAARVLLRLARATARDEFGHRACEALDACRSSYRASDLLAAPYVQAVADAAAGTR